MSYFMCPNCLQVSEIDPQTWFESECLLTLQDDDPRVMCEHCLHIIPSLLHTTPFRLRDTPDKSTTLPGQKTLFDDE